MNPQTHRLIFNPTRGCLMAVAETSRSCGKSSASGATRSTRTKRTRCRRRAEVQASNRPLDPVYIAQAATNSIASTRFRDGITNTTVGRVAGLYVTGDAGVLLASAGRDINIIASEIKNSGANSQTVLMAQNDINLDTLQERQTNNLEFDANNFRHATSTSEAGSRIEGAGTPHATPLAHGSWICGQHN
jgi:hypothetical protein